MSELYAPYKNTDAVGTVAGFRNNAWISLKEWITTEVVPVATSVMGDHYKIATAHTWEEGKGAIPVYLFPKTAEPAGRAGW